MGSHEDTENDFTSVIDDLVAMFPSHIVTREAISTLVESCEGDLNLSVDAIMKITNDDNTVKPQDNNKPSTSKKSSTKLPSQMIKPSTSYATSAAQNKGAIPKLSHKNTSITVQRTKSIQDFWTDQIREIIINHNKGSRIMIILRGAPGSGKSYLAKLLIESMVGPRFTNYNNHILSADDYFMIRGQYVYDKFKLSYAHAWNQDRARECARQGISPIIIDNTNIEIWEMQPYAAQAVKYGYIIEVVEPKTPWAKKANQLLKRNTHNVPLITIKRMLDNYTENVTGESLMRDFGLSYPADMMPPVKRNIPPILTDDVSSSRSIKKESDSPPQASSIQISPECSDQNVQDPIQQEELFLNETALADDPKENQQDDNATTEDMDDLTQEEIARQKFVLEAQKRLEELEKFELEWENGEEWDENNQAGAVAISEHSAISTDISISNIAYTSSIVSTTSPKNTTTFITTLVAKPPRNEKNGKLCDESNPTDGLMQSVNDCHDWRDISLFMPPWVSPDEQANIAPVEEIPIETTTSSTCVENGDTNLSGDYKIISATSRDINEFYIPPDREKIPDKRMFDKSTMTNEEMMMTSHCPQRDRHFTAFRRLFKHIERDSLKYIFDNCCGDVNWAVENVLGGGIDYELKKTEDQEESDTEDEINTDNDQPCTCLAKYEIIPNTSKCDVAQTTPEIEITEASTVYPVPQTEKKKKDVTISDETMQLKKQIEQNIVIPDSLYSEHCLKIKKIRRGEYKTKDDVSEQPSTSGSPDVGSALDSSSTTAPMADSSDDEEGSCNLSDSDKIVNINVGHAFIKNLDKMFGREDMVYPDSISFNISIPTSLLNEINALWMESMMFQLDEMAKQSAEMVKQDEAFARQIALKEAEILLAGEQPDVPDFKEIMDLELAISLHLKDMSEWKNNIPNDLAAKLTHDKLFNLFPEIEKDILLEMLMAHDNNFKATVEVLLMSMGRNDVLEAENGLNKFVMEKELERQEKVLEEQRKELSKAEWPPLPRGEVIDMSTVQAYRDEAEKHLLRRNTHMQRAEEYIRRGFPQVASYYSEIATYHKTKYEHANSMAVASLMQYHANNNPDGETVDLHFFRVKEAKETMDLFIDTHIHKLRESNKRGIMLFFITGRGLHSPGRPKVKPACIKRLQERGLSLDVKDIEYEFRCGTNAAEMARDSNTALGEEIANERTLH